jgi:hypothetical protein
MKTGHSIRPEEAQTRLKESEKMNPEILLSIELQITLK